MKSTKRTTKAKAVAKPARSPGLKMAAAALESLPANVLVANLDFEVVYINDCAKQALGEIAGEIHRAFGVKVDDILGASLQTIHQDARRVKEFLKSPQALPHQAEFSFGPI